MTMINSKVLLLAQSFLLLSYRVSCQSPNGTLFIPGAAIIASELGASAAVVVSQVTVEGQSTIFQLVDALPTAVGVDALTATLALSPTGASLNAAAPAAGVNSVDITCSISGGESSCNFQAEAVADGITVPISSTFTQPTSGVPVVAINFATGTAESGSAAPTSGSNSASGSSSASSSSGGSASSSGSQTAASSPSTTPAVSNNPSSSNSGSSSSVTSPAPAASTTQPSSAMGLHISITSLFIGFCLVLGSL